MYRYVDKIECLEEKKRTAVEQEDFMLAEDLKIQIHDCRQKEAATKIHECADEVGHLESAINLRDHVPDELVCPITFEVFKSPMVCSAERQPWPVGSAVSNSPICLQLFCRCVPMGIHMSKLPSSTGSKPTILRRKPTSRCSPH